MSEITWGTSQQIRLTSILDGHEFQKKLETKTTTHWKCSKWSSYKCNVTAITTGKQLLSKKNEHNHETVPGHVQAKQIIGQMKETARTKQNPVNSMIISSSLLPIGSDIATQLSMPTRSAINRTLNRQKASENLQEPPITDRHFEVPAKFKEFCLYDTGTTDNERMLIFGTQENLESLKTNNALWLCDGTFKVSLIQFYQLYTIHIQIGGFYPPCIYALLSNKRENSYRKLLVDLDQLTGGVWPEKILLDFEKAAINIFSEQYPASEINGCYFHFCQSFNRKICELGLKRIYENKPGTSIDFANDSCTQFGP